MSSTLEILNSTECVALMRGASVGRLAAADADGSILVVPVNYTLDGDVIVFRTDTGKKLNLVQHRPVSFEVDYVDDGHHGGWSVLVRGRAYEATHWEVDHLDIEPWISGQKDHWVRIEPETITGRRITSRQ